MGNIEQVNEADPGGIKERFSKEFSGSSHEVTLVEPTLEENFIDAALLNAISRLRKKY